MGLCGVYTDCGRQRSINGFEFKVYLVSYHLFLLSCWLLRRTMPYPEYHVKRTPPIGDLPLLHAVCVI